MSSNISFVEIIEVFKEMDIGQLQSMRCALDNAISVKAKSPTKVNVSTEPQIPAEVGDFVTYEGVRLFDKTTEDLILAELMSMDFKSKSSKDCVQNVFCL